MPAVSESVPVSPAAGPIKLLYVGRLVSWKGVHLLIASLAVLRKRLDVRLTVIGDGPQQAELRRLCSALGVAGAVEWLGRLPQHEVLRRYADHDMMVFPSLHDSGGMVVLEAMSRGLPVIALDLGGPALVVDASCGRLIATHRAGEAVVAARLAQAISEIAADRQVLDGLRAGARRKAARHTWSQVVGSAYAQVMRNGPCAGPRRG
jgi:glycosyltransferase involved in cell wall biosynthesis